MYIQLYASTSMSPSNYTNSAGFAFGAAVQFLCYVCQTCVPEASSSSNPTIASLFCKENREGRSLMNIQ